MEEEIDIYGDLEAFGDDKSEILPEAAKVLQQENEVLQKKNEELTAELERITKYSKSLEVNISSLHKTAKVEITRKDRMISDLRQQLDNAAFRRTTNYRIPKRIPKPSVISLPPKDEFTCTEIKKEPVNDTINKKETEYQSPLTTSEALDEPENCYQPETIPVTLFGERLKRKLEQESREEAEAIEKAREEQARRQQVDNRGESSDNTEITKNKEDKESKYRLIPLTLQKLAENSRKRGSESLERSDNLEPPKKEDYFKSGDSHENKRRKFDSIEEKREKSPRVDRHNNSTGDTQRKRPEIKTEYSCPGKTDSSGSRSRSKSREKRDRRNPHSSLDRRKNPRERSKSPPRVHDSGKDKYRSSRKPSADRYGKRSRDNSPSLRRLNRKDINPPVSRIDVRSRLKGRYNDKVDGKIHADVGRRNRRNVNIRRSDMPRKSPRQICRKSHNDNRRIDDSKYSRRSCTNESRQNDARKSKKEKSNSPHTERTGRDSSERKIKIQETERLLPSSLTGKISVIDKMQVDLEDIEEGEIIDSPERESPEPSGWLAGSRIIEPLVEDDRLHSTINEGASRNLDDSLREEKIENIELFIEKLQSDDGELFRKQGRTEGQKLQSLWKNQQGLGSGGAEIASHDRKINRQMEEDTSEESVHLTSILEDSSDDEACEPASDRPTAALNNNEEEKAIDNDTSSPSKLMLNGAKPSAIVGVLATSPSADKSSQVVSDSINNQKIFKNEAPQSPTPKSTDNNQVKSSVGEGPEENESRTEKMPKCSKLLDALQTPRVILQEIDSSSKASVKSNDTHPQKSVPKEKENSGGKGDKIIIVARRRRIRLTDSSTSMTVVVSAKVTDKN
ncbi:nuclear speckle splicing regulatory protein 1-like [Diachasmimorpha longicaudata]|uniref:nuclear speckle splicing regulatory protein 1-like n=1 Tax=Diachasmimorpha longicaudata TaxID=58733 RepID=UPI0030B919B9